MDQHWILVVFDCVKNTLTQYDTIRKSTRVAERIIKFIEKTKGIQGITINAEQQIVQNDGYNCGVHVIELTCQIAQGIRDPSTYLTREKVCDKLIDFGFTSK